MSDNNTSTSYGGPGCLTLMFILFLGLKLAGIAPVAHWSWWLITAPIWAGWTVVLLFWIAFSILVALASE